MKRLAFKMQLHSGQQEEYKKRHDKLWPELQELLKQSGISEYSIYLDKTTNNLFGVLKVDDESLIERLSQHSIMKRWWDFMKDIMETNPDNSPVSIPLNEIFYLP